MRPFAATGVLGSYTTFSAYAVEASALGAGGRTGFAAAAGQGLARRLGAPG